LIDGISISVCKIWDEIRYAFFFVFCFFVCLTVCPYHTYRRCSFCSESVFLLKKTAISYPKENNWNTSISVYLTKQYWICSNKFKEILIKLLFNWGLIKLRNITQQNLILFAKNISGYNEYKSYSYWF